MRRYGEPRKSGQAYITRPGAYAILVSGDQVLLTFQQTPYPELQLPGGGIDPGESPVQALHREVIEETGYRIGTPRRLGAYQRYCFMPEYEIWARKVCHIYLARAGRRISEPLEVAHHAVWLPWHEAVDAVEIAGDRDFLSAFFNT